ncbi:MAG: primosomal protein N' [Candidatus Hydrogenedentes bacterium]|nr:primosomal protein N' [Candidatus Hydrogenedentota bacterium]
MLLPTEEMYIDVALPLALDRPLSYQVPLSLHDRVQVGLRVLVPLQSRLVLGFVVRIHNECPPGRVKEVVDFPDESPVFDAGMLELCNWLSSYYCCSWGEALSAALPAVAKGRVQRRYHLVPERLSTYTLSERQQEVIKTLYYRNASMTSQQLAAAVGSTGLGTILASLTKRGLLREEIQLPDVKQGTLTETRVQFVKAEALDNEALMAMQRRAPRRAAVYMDLLYGEKEQSSTALYRKHKADKSVLNALEKQGLIKRFEVEVYRKPEITGDDRAACKHELNDEQRTALNALLDAVHKKQYNTFLLKGITGSGKTEVYLQAIETVLAEGRSAIMLVPEISLTPQTVGRFYSRFNQDIAILHSGLSSGERYDAWRQAREGKVRIVVGARSAVFAPLPNLGMIIVDEEHDSSYKQNETPRYHARDVAIMRAKMNDAVCVLGSATPSVESFFNSETAKSTRLELTRRATSACLPEVHLIDMRKEQHQTPGQLILSPILEEAVEKRVEAGEQVTLLLNRRGFAPVVLCPMCGWVAECDNCQVSLTYHSAHNALHCHYCGSTCPKPLVCRACHFNPLVFLGSGTQKAEDYLMRTFGSARVERMDADTTSGKGGHAKILGRFAKHEIDILVGTQMLAKGHDFPRVTLVGVLNADYGLSLPDFRAGEQIFQLLTQVAGRAGRGDRPGQVYIQTFRPAHFAIQAAANHDYQGFYAREIESRRDAGYPPFRRMVNFMIESEDPLAAEKMSGRLRRLACARLDELGFLGVALLGPAPATIRRVKKKYRWNFAIMSKSAVRVNQLARELRSLFIQEPGNDKVQLKVDLDPYGMF